MIYFIIITKITEIGTLLFFRNLAAADLCVMSDLFEWLTGYMVSQ
jgi:hypothetical protein